MNADDPEWHPEYSPARRLPNRSRSQQEQVNPPTSFEFVSSNNRSQIRSHAMRESWRRRNQRNGSLAGGQPTLPQRSFQAQIDNHESPVSSPEEIPDDDRLLPRDTIFVDLRHTVKPPRGMNSVPKWKVSSLPGSLAQFYTPYQELSGNNAIDPFNCLRLDLEDQHLLYHWVNIYAQQAFGQPTDPSFGPMRDLYVPVDLSHEAATHAVLAHSAAHSAHIRGERNSIKAITHKMAAIHLVNEYLNDPQKAVSDEAFSAVLRLLTFERYWGTERTWRLHRKGLAQMVKKRGGLSSFPNDWRIEMRIQIVSLMPVPSWTNPAFAQSADPNLEENYEAPHSNFVNFFQDIKADTLNIRHQYPAIARAKIFLRSSRHTADNDDRLMCLFYIAIIMKDSNHRHYDLSWLNDSLHKTEDVWTSSVQSLRWLLLQGMGRGPEGPDAMLRTERLEIVARGLKEHSWRRMEDRLLSLILGPEERGDIFMEDSPSP